MGTTEKEFIKETGNQKPLSNGFCAICFYQKHIKWLERKNQLRNEGNKIDWVEFDKNQEYFQESAINNCLCKFDNGVIMNYNDNHPIAKLTHFEILPKIYSNDIDSESKKLYKECSNCAINDDCDSNTKYAFTGDLLLCWKKVKD